MLDGNCLVSTMLEPVDGQNGSYNDAEEEDVSQPLENHLFWRTFLLFFISVMLMVLVHVESRY